MGEPDRGASWSQQADFVQFTAALPREGAEIYTLKKLIMDLHTGKAFFGKVGEWVWIDVLGIVLMLLSVTSGYMWWRSRRATSA